MEKSHEKTGIPIISRVARWLRGDKSADSDAGKSVPSVFESVFGANGSTSTARAEQADSTADSTIDAGAANAGTSLQPGNNADKPDCSSAANHPGSNDGRAGNGAAVRTINPAGESSGTCQIKETEMTTETQTGNAQDVLNTVANTALQTVQTYGPAVIAGGIGVAAITNPSTAVGISVALTLMPQALKVSQTLMEMMQAPNVNATALLQMQANLYQEILLAQQQWEANNAATGVTTVAIPATPATQPAETTQTVVPATAGSTTGNA